MNIIIRNSSGLPIYEQIYNQIKSAILSGELNNGDSLPSIRALAKDLKVSVITTKRAYDELEQDGYINTVAAKGCFVAERDLEIIREENLRKIEEHLSEIAMLASSCNLTKEDLIEMLYVLGEEGYE